MNKNRLTWLYPWGYTESFTIAFSLVLMGFVLEYINSKTLTALSWPINFYVGIIFITLYLFLHLKFKEKPFIKWLSSTQAAVSAICLYTFLVLIMGFIPQVETNSNEFIQKLGLTHITYNYAFLLIQVYFLTSLAMTTLRRSFPLKGKNIAFFINHFGLWLTLFAASLGAGDMQRIVIDINSHEPVYAGINQRNEVIHDLGIAIKLKEFYIEEYPPKAYIIDAQTGDILNEQLIYIEKDSKQDILNWKIQVTEYYEYAISNDGKFFPIYDIGAVPAAYLKVTNYKTDSIYESWISSGSFRFPPSFLELNDTTLLVMGEPEPKKYSSDIIIYSKTGNVYEARIEVNKPVSIDGWKIYLLDYNHDLGKWSDTNKVELIKDPWLPVVYTGIILLVIGAIYLFWIGNLSGSRQNKKKAE